MFLSLVISKDAASIAAAVAFFFGAAALIAVTRAFFRLEIDNFYENAMWISY